VSSAIPPERRVPALRRLGQDTSPAELFLQQVGIAQVDAVGGTKLDEVPPVLEIKRRQREQVLPQLGSRRVEMREQLRGVLVRQGQQKVEIAPRLVVRSGLANQMLDVPVARDFDPQAVQGLLDPLLHGHGNDAV